MTPEEQSDLDRLKVESDAIRARAFNAMNNALRLTPEELKNTGYKTNEAAAIGHYKYAESMIQALIKEHLKKYPDEGIKRKN